MTGSWVLTPVVLQAQGLLQSRSLELPHSPSLGPVPGYQICTDSAIFLNTFCVFLWLDILKGSDQSKVSALSIRSQ